MGLQCVWEGFQWTLLQYHSLRGYISRPSKIRFTERTEPSAKSTKMCRKTCNVPNSTQEVYANSKFRPSAPWGWGGSSTMTTHAWFHKAVPAYSRARSKNLRSKSVKNLASITILTAQPRPVTGWWKVTPAGLSAVCWLCADCLCIRLPLHDPAPTSSPYSYPGKIYAQRNQIFRFLFCQYFTPPPSSVGQEKSCGQENLLESQN